MDKIAAEQIVTELLDQTVCECKFAIVDGKPIIECPGDKAMFCDLRLTTQAIVASMDSAI
jgi:hypothetical protein